MIQCFHYTATGIQKLFRIQFFIGCLDKQSIRFIQYFFFLSFLFQSNEIFQSNRFFKEDLDDACSNKKFPDNCFVELLFVSLETKYGAHFLESFIPEDIKIKSGNTCYFDDPVLNHKYIQ